MAEITEERIRERAFHIWEREGCPEGRADDHWQMARQELAIEDADGGPTLPNPIAETGSDVAPGGEGVEPLEAVENQGEFPGLTDQGEEQQYPRRRAATTRRRQRQ